MTTEEQLPNWYTLTDGNAWLCFCLLFCSTLRDRPFNLQGGGGYEVFFRSEIFFRPTRKLEYFFLSRKARIFFPEFNIWQKLWIRLFFFFPQNQNLFFSNIGNHNIFLGKNLPPVKLNGRSLKRARVVLFSSYFSWVQHLNKYST